MAKSEEPSDHFNMKVDPEWMKRIDDWHRKQEICGQGRRRSGAWWSLD